MNKNGEKKESNVCVGEEERGRERASVCVESEKERERLKEVESRASPEGSVCKPLSTPQSCFHKEIYKTGLRCALPPCIMRVWVCVCQCVCVRECVYVREIMFQRVWMWKCFPWQTKL